MSNYYQRVDKWYMVSPLATNLLLSTHKDASRVSDVVEFQILEIV